MIDKQAVLSQVEFLQERIGEFYQELGALKLLVTDLVEENRQLSIENVHLRDRARMYTEEHVPVPGEAAHYLGQLYEDGFHICNVNYGSLRHGDCLFCLQSLQRT